MVRDGQQLRGRASSKYAKQHPDPCNYTNAEYLTKGEEEALGAILQ